MSTLRLLIIFFVISISLAAEKIKPTIGVLPFTNNSSKSMQWLSFGLADSIIAKLSKVDSINLVEREYLQQLIIQHNLSSEDQRLTGLSGADFILTGSYTVLGEKIRIHGRVISSESGTLSTSSISSITGDLNKIFELESKIARNFASICKIELPGFAAQYHEAGNTSSYQLYNQAKILYYQNKLTEAIKTFRQAQEKNKGLFFAEAHNWEGRTRTALAEAEKNWHKSQEIQNQHLKKFRDDAAKAAPALFDLGLAHKSCGNYREAIRAFDDYLKWHDQNANPFRWEETGFNKRFIFLTEDAPNYFGHGKRETQQCNIAAASYFDNWRHWILNDGLIFFVKDSTLFCREISSGKLRWQAKVPTPQDTMNNRGWLDAKANFLILRDNTIYYSNLSCIYSFNTNDGSSIKQIKLGEKKHPFGRLFINSQQTRSLLFYGDRNNLYLNTINLASGVAIDKKLPAKFSFNKIFAPGYDTIYTTTKDQRQLVKFDFENGNFTEVAKVNTPIEQLYPAFDHLLVRCSHDKFQYELDSYYKFNFHNKELTKFNQRIIFTNFYNKMPERLENLSVPMIPMGQKHYKLIPAKEFYPASIVKKMDSRDDFHLQSRHKLPYHLIRNQKLYSWYPTRTLRVKDLVSGDLLWKMHLPYSTSMTDSWDKFTIAKIDNWTMRIYNTNSSADTKRTIKAYQHKAFCHDKQQEYNEAINALSTALKNSPDDITTCQMMAKAYEKIGCLNVSAEYHALTARLSKPKSTTYNQALNSLNQQLGLKDILPFNDVHKQLTFNRKIYFVAKVDNECDMYEYEPEARKLCSKIVKSVQTIFTSENKLYYIGKSDKRIYQFDPVSCKSTPICKLSHYFGKNDKISWKRNHQNDYTIYKNHFIYFQEIFPNYIEAKSINLSDGSIKWQKTLRGRYHLCLTKNHLIHAHYSKFKEHGNKINKVHCFKLDNNELTWSRILTAYHSDSRPKTRSITYYDETAHGVIAYEYKDTLFLCFRYPRSANHAPNVKPFATLHALKLNSGVTKYNIGLPEPPSKLLKKNEQAMLCIDKWNYPSHHFRFIPLNNRLLEVMANPQLPTVALHDLYRTHPAILAQFPPLKSLSNEFDLNKHCKKLNTLLSSKQQCDNLLEQYRESFNKRNICPPGRDLSELVFISQHVHLLELLNKPDRTVNESRLAARFMSSYWQSIDPHISILPYMDFDTVRTEFNCPIEFNSKNYYLGYYCGRLQLSDADNHCRLLGTWMRTPMFFPHQAYNSGISSIDSNGHEIVIRSKRGLFIYNKEKLMNYMLNNVNWKEAYFTTSTTIDDPLSLKSAKSASTLYAKHPHKLTFGYDFGLQKRCNKVKIFLDETSKNDLKGAIIQAANYSETAGLYNLKVIKSPITKGREVTIEFENNSKFRFYRITDPHNKSLKIRKLEFTP